MVCQKRGLLLPPDDRTAERVQINFFSYLHLYEDEIIEYFFVVIFITINDDKGSFVFEKAQLVLNFLIVHYFNLDQGWAIILVRGPY